MGSPSAETPTPPAAPTAGGSLQEYIDLSPQLFETEQEYQPQYAQLAKQIQEQLYPETTGLGEQLAGQASRGISEDIPPEWRESYRSNMASMLGENVKSTIGADYMSTGLMQQQKEWQDYYRNMGLSLSGRQPLVQGQSLTGGFTPQSIMGANTSNYGTQAGIYGNQLQNSQFQQSYSPPWQNALGNVAGIGVGSLAGGYGGALGAKWGG